MYHDLLIDVRLFVVAVDLRCPAVVPYCFDECINFINEFRSEAKFQTSKSQINQFTVMIWMYSLFVCSASHLISGYAEHASLYYSEGFHDCESAIVYITYSIQIGS
jgi:hypothetical protein